MNNRIIAILSILLTIGAISCSAQSSILGADVRLLADKKSIGGSVEIGKEYSFGWIFLQGSFTNRQFDYDQTFSVVNWIGSSNGSGTGEAQFNVRSATVIGGENFAPGEYESRAHAAYFPHGTQFTISTSYCYPLTQSVILGPTIGITYQNQSPVAGGELHTVVYGPFAPQQPNLAAQPTDKKIIIGNFGGCLKISITGASKSVWLLLDYATQTGAGLGFAILL